MLDATRDALAPFEALDRTQILDDAVARGRHLVGIAPLYGPTEVVAALGLHPVTLWPPTPVTSMDEPSLPGATCPIGRALDHAARARDLSRYSSIVVPSTCDTLHGLYGAWRLAMPDLPISFVAYPHRHAKGGRPHLRRELLALTKELASRHEVALDRTIQAAAIDAQHTGDNLVRSLYARRRRLPLLLHPRRFYAILEAATYMDRAAHNALLEPLVRVLADEPDDILDDRQPIILSGIHPGEAGLFDVIDRSGLVVVDDDLAFGARRYFHNARIHDDVHDYHMERYFTFVPCATTHDPRQARGPYILHRARAAKAKGVVFVTVAACDPELFDIPGLFAHLAQAGLDGIVIETDLAGGGLDVVEERLGMFKGLLMRGKQRKKAIKGVEREDNPSLAEQDQ